jgi:hypothetical protein
MAECLALASSNSDGTRLGNLAVTGGVRIGLGRVDVADGIAANTTPRVTMGDGDVAPKVGSAPTFHDRLAWVVVVADQMIVPCPMILTGNGTPSARRQPAARATDFDYQVFVLDAETGGDALMYTEGRPALCGGPGRLAPSVSVPTDWVSVPWSMAVRNPDGYSATISVDMLSCDGYDPLVLPSEDTPDIVQVLVQRPIGHACGVAVHRRLTLHAATIAARLPAMLVHAPLGLSVPSSR